MKDCAISKMLFFYFVYIKCILIGKLDGERPLGSGWLRGLDVV